MTSDIISWLIYLLRVHSKVEYLARAIYSIVDKSMVQRQILAHNKLAGFLRGDSTKEGAHTVKLRAPVPQHFFQVSLIELVFLLHRIGHSLSFQFHSCEIGGLICRII